MVSIYVLHPHEVHCTPLSPNKSHIEELKAAGEFHPGPCLSVFPPVFGRQEQGEAFLGSGRQVMAHERDQLTVQVEP